MQSHETSVVAAVAVGQGKLKVLREMQTYE